MSRTRFYNPQFDLFLPSIVDLRFRDQKDTMERPFFSLSKSKRMKPIEYLNENDGIFVTVQPHQDYGMATIWDADILIWAASVLCDMKNRGINDIPRVLNFQPYDLLKAIGRADRRRRLCAAARRAGTAQDHGHHHQYPRDEAWPQGRNVQLDRRVGRPD
jgi:plasmid replication initiation protein